MELSHRMICQEFLMALVCYEMFCGHLSSEMKYLFEMHLKQCPSCHYKILAFQQMLQDPLIVPNFG